ncbi:hypothetical protein SELMODRAFT_137553 [Selaginella moellendorffii]|uniref:Cyanovirin-N domain-containing protein n=1 Tax=Selaginella moellendorffii TaxID=88036 RepID=D8TDT8_SELML|nr:hypothetical protein SELMODRAFT_137553 [Selaginella moellendorffii]
MASTNNVLLFVSIVAASIILASTEGSTFVTFQSPDCTNRVLVTRCGCNNLDASVGYGFEWHKQRESTANLYNQPDCKGSPHTSLDSSVSACGPIGWKSIEISCK